MPPSKSGKQDAKPLNRSGTNQINKDKPFARASARTARTAPPVARDGASAPSKGPGLPDEEQKILFQKFFKSVGPRTYAAQIKEAKNGNYFIVLTEGKRDKETGEIRKTKLLIFSEDFREFFKLLGDTAAFLREHPVPAEIRAKRERFWAKQNGQSKSPAPSNGREVKPPPVPTRARVADNRNRR